MSGQEDNSITENILINQGYMMAALSLLLVCSPRGNLVEFREERLEVAKELDRRTEIVTELLETLIKSEQSSQQGSN